MKYPGLRVDALLHGGRPDGYVPVTEEAAANFGRLGITTISSGGVYFARAQYVLYAEEAETIFRLLGREDAMAALKDFIASDSGDPEDLVRMADTMRRLQD